MISAVALDLGTTTIKAGLLSPDGTLSGIVARPAPGIAAEGGRYESDASAYATTAEVVLAECLAQTDARPRHGGAEPFGAGAGALHFLPQTADFVGNVSEVHPPLGLCSQRSSFLLWDRASGLPVTPLISWQDDRGAESCAALRDQEDIIRELAGLPLTPYYLAPKLRVLLREHPSWRDRLVRGEWLLGTLDTFLVWRWTGGTQHLTDVSMAARTLLMDIHSLQWSPALCELFGIPQQVLPRIQSSAGLGLRLENGLLLQASMGDQSAALVASIAPGQPEALVNLGTGGFVVCYLPEGRSVPPGYLQTLVWQEATQRVHLASEGTLNSIAAALAPYPVDACRVEELAGDNIFCLAEPSGLGAPYFRSDLGVTFSEPAGHLPAQRIALLLQEGIIFRVARILEDFHREFGIERVYLSGGLSSLPCLQQGIARCVAFDTYRLLQTDASLRGAAQLAAGMSLVNGRSAEKIVVCQSGRGMTEKYARWKVWLDGLLRTRPVGQFGQAL
jgi:glycerol kinase